MCFVVINVRCLVSGVQIREKLMASSKNVTVIPIRVLSLDGGNMRAITQIEILRAIETISEKKVAIAIPPIPLSSSLVLSVCVAADSRFIRRDSWYWQWCIIGRCSSYGN